jgi:hypothetical protein
VAAAYTQDKVNTRYTHRDIFAISGNRTDDRNNRPGQGSSSLRPQDLPDMQQMAFCDGNSLLSGRRWKYCPLSAVPLFHCSAVPLSALALFRCCAVRCSLSAVRCCAVPLFRCSAVPLFRCPLFRCSAVELFAVRCPLSAVALASKVPSCQDHIVPQSPSL